MESSKALDEYDLTLAVMIDATLGAQTSTISYSPWCWRDNCSSEVGEASLSASRSRGARSAASASQRQPLWAFPVQGNVAGREHSFVRCPQSGMRRMGDTAQRNDHKLVLVLVLNL